VKQALPGNGTGRAALYALVSVALWPVAEAFGGLILRNHTIYQTVWLRYTTHILLLVLVCLPRGGLRLFATRRPVLQICRGLLMFGMPVAFIASAQQASWRDAWAMLWVFPFMVLLAAPVLLGERSGRWRWMAAAVGFIGAMVVVQPDAGIRAAFLPGLLVAATFAGYVLITRMLRGESLTASLFYTALGALIPLTVAQPFVWTPLQPSDVVGMLGIGGLGLLVLAFLDRALEHADAGFIAPFYFGVVVAETFLVTLARGLPRLSVLAGCVLVCAGIAMVFMERLPRVSGTAEAAA
jgi:drug/metabolite transporter (DMT)-like permease